MTMPDLEGELLELRPAHLLDFLGATRKTGMLRVTGRQHTLTVWLAEGAAVAADSTQPTANPPDLVDQLVELLRTPTGTFRFVEGALAKPELAQAPDHDLLPRAVQRLHDWEDLADAVPSLSLIVKLVNTDDDDVTLSAGAWSVSVAVSSGSASVAAAAKHLGWSAFRTCLAVRELVEAGRASLAPPPKRRRRSNKADVSSVSGGVWHPANRPLWPGSGTRESDRFRDAWAFDE